MKAQHTPGPWRVINSVVVLDKSNRVISDCNIDYSGNISTEKPLKAGLVNACNARLIAAAPDLLAALHTIAARLEGTNINTPIKDMRDINYLAYAAIAKAEGI